MPASPVHLAYKGLWYILFQFSTDGDLCSRILMEDKLWFLISDLILSLTRTIPIKKKKKHSLASHNFHHWSRDNAFFLSVYQSFLEFDEETSKDIDAESAGIVEKK